MFNLKLYNKKMIRVKHKIYDIEYTYTWSIEKDKYIVIRNKYINGIYSPGGWSEFKITRLEKLQSLVSGLFCAIF